MAQNDTSTGVKGRALRATVCRIKGHDWNTHLYLYPRPGMSPPGNQEHRVCQRCGYAPDCTRHCDLDTDSPDENQQEEARNHE